MLTLILFRMFLPTDGILKLTSVDILSITAQSTNNDAYRDKRDITLEITFPSEDCSAEYILSGGRLIAKTSTDEDSRSQNHGTRGMEPSPDGMVAKDVLKCAEIKRKVEVRRLQAQQTLFNNSAYGLKN